jgi:hypothetical protein
MGMALLQKMGWRPGEGLGKNKEGALEPLQLEIKLDKRGLVSEQDIGQKIGKTTRPLIPAIKTLEGILIIINNIIIFILDSYIIMICS